MLAKFGGPGLPSRDERLSLPKILSDPWRIMLSLDSTNSRMSNLAGQELYVGRLFTLARALP